ncbi:MAG: glycosyltransferase family 1 protein [Pyrinomonadaceae bacterium]
MKIGVDACCWGNKRGFGRFTRGLLEALVEIDEDNEYLFFIDSKTDDRESIPTRAKTVVVQTEKSATMAASSEGRRPITDLLAMSRAVFQHKLDVFFFPAVYSYFPIFNRTKVVLTIHDVIADHNPQLVFPNKKLAFFWKLKQNIAVRQAHLLLTVSEHSKRQISEFFGMSESRIEVVTEGARPAFRVLPGDDTKFEILRKYGLEKAGKFLLYVGGISPHKNLSTLINAFARIRQTRSDLKLVLVGDYKDDPFFSAYPHLKRQVSDLRLDANVIFTGFVPDDDLVVLYNAAKALVFPSFEEGFGLPAIEAMSCGTPVIASDNSSLPEVVGTAGRLFDPYDEQSMTGAIDAVLADESLRISMKEAGLRRAGQFGWKQAAAKMVVVFDSLNAKKVKAGATRGKVVDSVVSNKA